MNIYDNSRSSRNRAPLARALAGMLLAGLVYAATFGFSHTHEVSAAHHTHTFAADGQKNVVSQAPQQSRSDESECLICVLHRQFSNTTIHTPLFIAGPAEQIAEASVQIDFHYSGLTNSRPLARLSGRAPPSRA